MSCETVNDCKGKKAFERRRALSSSLNGGTTRGSRANLTAQMAEMKGRLSVLEARLDRVVGDE
jgi:hypothetical protein